VQPVDEIRDVRGVALAPEDPARVELPAERRDVAAKRRRDLLDVRRVPRQAVEERRADQLLPHLPVRVRRRPSAERGAHDRRGDAVVAVLRQHLGDVEALGEGELLVRVADAVPPGQLQVLDEQRPLGVEYAALGDDEGRALGEALLPVRGDGASSLVVPRTVDGDDAAAAPGRVGRESERRRVEPDPTGAGHPDEARERPVRPARGE